MPGTVVMPNWMLASNMPTWPGCTRTTSPGANSRATTSPPSSTQAVQGPDSRCKQKPVAAKDARAERLLEPGAELDAGRGA